jgi:glutathione S-transferase
MRLSLSSHRIHYSLTFNEYSKEYSISRCTNETRRLYSVLDNHFKGNEYFAVDKFAIADIKTFLGERSPRSVCLS